MHTNTEKELTEITSWIRTIFAQNNKKDGIVAVSGGIDSAVSVTLLTHALGPQHVFPLFLPYAKQSTRDALLIAEWNGIPKTNWSTYNIEPIVTAAAELTESTSDRVRMGNYMARARMMIVYDCAKKLDALVCGTENRSEHYLGYFTRFGDAASDLEPLAHLYKTEVRLLAEYLKLPSIFLEKAPSAGLWNEQTDELELGFSYRDADAVCAADFDGAVELLKEMDPAVVEKVRNRVKSQQFKHTVPYQKQAS